MIVEYFDYTCASCRTTHKHITQAMQDNPGKFAVLLLPVPLNPDCNPHFPLRQDEHKNACFLTHFAYTVWHLAPEKFPEYHHWLFQQPSPGVLSARSKAEELVGKTQFLSGLRSPEVRKMMDQSISHYAAFVKLNPVMPKILLGKNLIMHGRAKDASAFEVSLEKQIAF